MDASCRHYPFAWETLTPPGSLRAQKVNLCALFSRSFRNPCDRDPPNRTFQKLEINSSKITKILNVYFWGNERLLLGNERLLLGNERLLLGIIGVFRVFGISFFVAGGFGDSVGRGAA